MEGTAGDAVSVLIGTGVPVLIVGVLFGVAWNRSEEMGLAEGRDRRDCQIGRTVRGLFRVRLVECRQRSVFP